jgi:cysteine synthase
MASSPAQSVLELIGRTPVLQLNHIQRKLGLRGRLLAKLEQMNPGRSMKDRLALQIIRSASHDGKLVRGQPVLEVTSGDHRTCLAVASRALSTAARASRCCSSFSATRQLFRPNEPIHLTEAREVFA